MICCWIEQQSDMRPAIWQIDCVCELLQTVGHTLDQNQVQDSVLLVFDRLWTLERLHPEAYPKRIVFKMRDMRELRANLWNMKVLKLEAKTIEDVHKGFREETLARKEGRCLFERRVAGEKKLLEPEGMFRMAWHDGLPYAAAHMPMYEEWMGYVGMSWELTKLPQSSASTVPWEKHHVSLPMVAEVATTNLSDDDASTCEGGGDDTDVEIDEGDIRGPIEAVFDFVKSVKEIQGSNERCVAKAMFSFGEGTFTLLAKRCKRRKGGSSFKTARGVCTAQVRCNSGIDKNLSVSVHINGTLLALQRHNFKQQLVCNINEELDLTTAIDRAGLFKVQFKFGSPT